MADDVASSASPPDGVPVELDVDGPLGHGQIVRATVAAHRRWGIEVELDGLDAFATVDLRFVSDERRDMNPDRFPPIGTKVDAVVQGMMPSGQLRVSLRPSDLQRAKAG